MRERQLAHRYDHDHAPITRDVHHGTPGRSTLTEHLAPVARPTASGILMRKATGDVDAHASEAVGHAATSSGHSLPDDLRARFEGSLGTDLSSVRVHTGNESAAAAQAVGARAYTVGSDIHFGANQYDPGSPAGQHLIAHEVAHTVQQRGAAPARQNKLAVSQPGDSFELEADRAADAMVAGSPAQVAGSGGGTIARKEDSLKPGSGKPTPKADSEKASVPDQSIDIKLFGLPGTIKCTEEGISGGLALTKLPPAESELLKMEHEWHVPLAAGGGVIVALKGEVKASASASITATGGTKDYGGPRENTMGFEGKIGGKGQMGVTATGRVEVKGYFGAAFANINAGGYVELSASTTASLSGEGSFNVYPEGIVDGNASSTFGADVTVKGTGGITIGYEAIIASGTFYEVELASHDFLTGKLGKKSTYDFKTGATTTADTSEKLKWKPIQFSKPKVMENKGDKMRKAIKKIVEDEKKKGNDIEGQQSVPREEDKKQTSESTDTYCDEDSSSCEK